MASGGNRAGRGRAEGVTYASVEVIDRLDKLELRRGVQRGGEAVRMDACTGWEVPVDAWRLHGACTGWEVPAPRMERQLGTVRCHEGAPTHTPTSLGATRHFTQRDTRPLPELRLQTWHEHRTMRRTFERRDASSMLATVP